jgi:hypothetical protein
MDLPESQKSENTSESAKWSIEEDWSASGALLGGDDGEGGPVLLHVVATTVCTDNPAFLIVDER